MEQQFDEQEYKLGNLSQGTELLKIRRRNTAGSVAALPYVLSVHFQVYVQDLGDSLHALW